jgi:hypothetical protein
MSTYHTWLIFNEGNTSITCPISGGELSMTNGDDTVYDESPATKFDIYVLITIIKSIPRMLDY